MPKVQECAWSLEELVASNENLITRESKARARTRFTYQRSVESMRQYIDRGSHDHLGYHRVEADIGAVRVILDEIGMTENVLRDVVAQPQQSRFQSAQLREVPTGLTQISIINLLVFKAEIYFRVVDQAGVV